MCVVMAGIFLGLIWGRISAPSQLKGQNLSKMVDIIPNFLVLHFGENFMEIRTKIPKLQMHEILHKDMNENIILHKNKFFIHILMQIFISFYEVQLKHQICYSFTLLIPYMF